jgi:hypothetical protein
MSYKLQHIDYVVSKTIKKGIEAAYDHIKNHVTAQDQILKLDADCEYCKVYFEEQRILNK